MLPQQKIRTQFLYRLITSIVLVFIVTVSFSTITEYNSLLKALHQRGNNLTELYSLALEKPLWNIDENEINQLLNAALKDKEVVAIELTASAAGENSKFSRNENLISDDLLVFKRDIFYQLDNQKIGQITFYMTRNIARLSVVYTFMSFAVTMILLLAAVIIISNLILQKVIYKPIENLLEGINHNVEHKTYQEVPVIDRNEIGILTESFNSMMTSIKEYANKYRSIFDNASYGIFQTTPEGKLLTANTAFARILGYDSPEDIISSIKELSKDLYAQPSRRADFLKIMNRDGIIEDFEFKALRKDRTEIDVSVNTRAIKDENNNIIFFEGMLEDISEKKNIEELKVAKEAAEASTRSKSEFLAHMSHEIRTPMNAISGFAELAMKTELSAKQRDYINKIDGAAKSLLGVINDILDFSKIEAGKLEMSSVDFNLHDVIGSMADMVSVNSSPKGIELIISAADNIPSSLIGDPLRLRQVLLNLTNNAVKFTEKGHILVEVAAIDKTETHCRLKFSVKDTGIGITKEQMSKLFSAFSQGDASLTRRFGGTGLGLVISRQLVNLMGGEISVTSTPGKGSNFSFTAQFQLQAEQKQTKHIVPEDIHGLKVLVVDDNAIVRTVLQNQLESFHFDVDTVASGEAALTALSRAATTRRYDLVLMDWLMPGIDGIEASRRIKQDLHIDHTPLIIMITAFGRDEVRQNAEKVGINSFLLKPVSSSLLFDTIMEVFKKPAVPTVKLPPSPVKQTETKGKIAGARVLLVDDSEINQQVAQENLEDAGLIVELANNGQEAVEAVTKNQYDVVLMDLQMPIMGGYEATREIRKDKKNDALPIIAMTAHAMGGVKEECLDAGMNDYVTKPIDIDALFRVLTKWINLKPDSQGDDQPATTKVKPKETREVKFPDTLPGIDLAEGLQRMVGNKALYKKLLLDFAGNYHQAIADIKSALQSDKELAHRLAHTIKGVAGNISANDVQAAANELDLAIIADKSSDYERLLSNLDKPLQVVLQAVKTLEADDEPPAKDVPIDYEKIVPILQEMTQLLKKDNFYAVKYFETLKDNLSEARFRDDLHEMEKHIGNIEFDEALKALEKIVAAVNNNKGTNIN